MTRITLTVHGAEMVRRGLEDLSNEVPKIGREQIYNVAIKAKGRMQEYPPERPNQRYVRTFRLKEGWQVERYGDIGYRLSNQVPYTARVVGDAYGNQQAPVHVGRWQLMRDVVEQETRNLREEIESHIRLVARRNNF